MLFGLLKRDPTEDWPLVEPAALRFDCQARSLNGVTLGAPADAIARFGRPDNRGATRKGEYEYRALGLTIGATADRVAWFAFSFEDAARPDFGPCVVSLVLPTGGTVELTSAVRRRDLERMLGRPGADLDGGDERTLVFNVAGTELEVAVDLTGRLLALDVDANAPAG